MNNNTRNQFYYEMHLLNEMSESSHNMKLKIYKENFDFLRYYQIIYVNDKLGKDNVKLMSDILSIDNQYLFSQFYSDNLFVINEKFILGETKIKYFFNIILDTQIVSYINRESLESNTLIKDIVSKLGRNRQFASSTFVGLYILENCLFTRKVNERVIENIKSFFLHQFLGHSKYKWIAHLRAKKATNKILNHIDSILDSPLAERKRIEFSLIYIILMKICIISLKKISLKKKLLELLDFQNSELMAIDIGLSELAIAFYKKKRSLRFFGKIQKGRDDLIDTINNMTWDLFYLRFLNISSSFKHIEGADVTLSLLCSIDKRLLEMRKYISLKMLAFDKRNSNFVPFYKMNEVKKILSTDEVTHYFGGKSLNKRLEEKAKVNLNHLKEKTENELVKTFK